MWKRQQKGEGDMAVWYLLCFTNRYNTARAVLSPARSFPFLVPGPHDQWAVGMSYEKLNADCFNFTEDMATPTKRKIENVSLLSFYHNF